MTEQQSFSHQRIGFVRSHGTVSFDETSCIFCSRTTDTKFAAKFQTSVRCASSFAPVCCLDLVLTGSNARANHFLMQEFARCVSPLTQTQKLDSMNHKRLKKLCKQRKHQSKIIHGRLRLTTVKKWQRIVRNPTSNAVSNSTGRPLCKTPRMNST